MSNKEQQIDKQQPAGAKVQGEGDYEAARKYDKDTERFLKSANVDDLAHKAAPKSKEEAAELKKAEEIGKSHRADVKDAKRTN